MLPTTGRVGNVGQPIGIAPPALHLPFAVGKVLDPRFTWTGATARTMYNSSGVLQYAPHQILANTNLSDQTDEVPAGWADFVGTGFKTFTDQGGYFEVSENAVANRTKLSIAAVPVLADTAYTVGVYVKSYTGAQPFVATLSTGGTDGAVASATFTGEGWYATGSLQGAGDTSLSFLVGLGLNANETATMVWSRPFIVKGLLPGVSVGTTGVKLSGPPLGEWIGIDDGDEPLYKPRFTHDPSDNTSLGLQIEGARTNICLQSENLSTTWTTSLASITANAVAAPDGNTTADAIHEDATAASAHFITQTIPFDGSSVYAFSAFVKPANRDWVGLIVTTEAFPGAVSMYWNVSTGASGTAGAGVDDSGIIDVGGGWYRIWLASTSDAAASSQFRVYAAEADTDVTFDGLDQDSLYVWGAQLEVGAFPSSYLPTTTAAVARAADVCSTTDLGWFNNTQGTFFVEWRQAPAVPADQYYFQIYDGSLNNRTYITTATGTDATIFASTSAAGDNLSITSSPDPDKNVNNKIAGAYATDDAASSLNGAAVGTDLAFDPWTVSATSFVLGNYGAAFDRYLFGTIAELKYWNTRLPNARLVTETT